MKVSMRRAEPRASRYTASFDGKPYPVKSTLDGKPNPGQDAITWKKIDDYTYENVAMLKGKALTTTRVTISRDGKTRTNAVTGQDAQGRTINNTVVSETVNTELGRLRRPPGASVHGGTRSWLLRGGTSSRAAQSRGRRRPCPTQQMGLALRIFKGRFPRRGPWR